MVQFRELLESEEYKNGDLSVPLALGKNIGGEAVMADLAKMPHLLVAGTTGSGKSVAVNTMILSIIYKLSPSECKFIMIDPKMLELSCWMVFHIYYLQLLLILKSCSSFALGSTGDGK